MATREFLVDIQVGVVKGLIDPLLPTDATNKRYVDSLLQPTTGTNISIDMGTFPEPINESIDAGGF